MAKFDYKKQKEIMMDLCPFGIIKKDYFLE